MNAKYLALFVAICLIEGLNARSAYKETPRISNEATIDTINKLINKITKSVESMEEVIENFEGIINENIEDISLPEIVAFLEEELEKIADSHNSSFPLFITCLVKQQPSLQHVQFLATKGAENCAADTENTRNKIMDMLTEVGLKAGTYISEITGNVMSCYNSNDVDAADCLQNLVNMSEEKVDVLLIEIDEAVRGSYKLAESANKDLSQCLAEVQKEILNLENMILTNFENCVA